MTNGTFMLSEYRYACDSEHLLEIKNISSYCTLGISAASFINSFKISCNEPYLPSS